MLYPTHYRQLATIVLMTCIGVIMHNVATWLLHYNLINGMHSLECPKMFWDITMTDWWVLTRPFTGQWSLKIYCHYLLKQFCCSMLVCLYCWSVRSHFTGNICDWVKNRKSFPSKILPYMVYTTTTLLAIYSYSYTASYS